MPRSPEALFAAVLAAAPAKPFVTYYDERSGERSELSAKSLANWVAKTHFLLSDELGLGVGDAAYLELSAHWISMPILLGAWTAGLEITTDASRAAVSFVMPREGAKIPAAPDVYAVAAEAAARGFAGTSAPPGTVDYVSAIRPQNDVWSAVHSPATPDDPALDGVSRADLVAKADSRAGELGVATGARLITGRGWQGPDDWTDSLLVPLAVSGSIVIVHGAAPEVLARRAEQERATRLP